MDLRKIHDFAIGIAIKSGSMILPAFKRDKIISTKSNPVDLLTETDVKVENFIKESICCHFPTHKFIGEESVGPDGKCSFTDDVTWIVDPIDGTCNFIHKFPYFCISIGITYQKEPVIGIIYNPLLDSMYSAVKGCGAYHNGCLIDVSKTKELKDSLLVSEFGSSRDPKDLDIKTSNLRSIISHCHGIRMLGTAAMNIMSIAHGEADAYFEYGLHCWDMAAAVVILREAGGYCLDPAGTEFDLMSRRIVCGSCKELCEEICQHLKHINYDRECSCTD